VGYRWGPEGPPEEAYGRVTAPERYAALADAADTVVASLADAYDVEVVEGPPAASDAPPAAAGGPARAIRAVRLTPATGARLIVTVTDFPGVRVDAGHWWSRTFPQCGCDACDETPEDLIEELSQTLVAVAEGGLVERLNRRWLAAGLTGGGWASEGNQRLDREQYAELSRRAPAGRYAWPPWPRRTPAG
jgi:hypothetical protein